MSNSNLAADRAGMAMVEFALVLPVLVALAVTGVETANYVMTVLRINQLAMMAADNAGRVRDSIDETDINEIMAGIQFAGSNINFGSNGRVIISSVQENGQTGSKKGNTITWQRCFGAKDVTSSYGVPGDGATDASMAEGIGTGTGSSKRRIKPVPSSALIFAEINYTYRPLISTKFMSEQVLTSTQAFTVRDRSVQTLKNDSKLSDANKRLCDSAHLSAT